MAYRATDPDESVLDRIARLQFPVFPHVTPRPRLDTPAAGYPKWHVPFGPTVAAVDFHAAGRPRPGRHGRRRRRPGVAAVDFHAAGRPPEGPHAG